MYIVKRKTTIKVQTSLMVRLYIPNKDIVRKSFLCDIQSFDQVLNMSLSIYNSDISDMISIPAII